jgi:hypothetical protein
MNLLITELDDDTSSLGLAKGKSSFLVDHSLPEVRLGKRLHCPVLNVIKLCGRCEAPKVG